MAWDDWVLGIATGGVYNGVKTIYKGSKAAEQAGNAAEDIADGVGAAAAAIVSNLAELTTDISSFLEAVQKLLVTRRRTPRNEADLQADELEQLNALRREEAKLLDDLKKLEESHSRGIGFGDVFGDITKRFDEMIIRNRLAIVRGAIVTILYQEPGDIPKLLEETRTTIAHVRMESLPRVEAVLGNIQNVFDSLSRYGVYIKYGLAIAGILLLLILVMCLIVLTKLAFGI